MTLKEVIEEKIVSARRDKDITFNELMVAKEINPKFRDLKKKYWGLIGNIEAYTDILALLESGKYE